MRRIAHFLYLLAVLFVSLWPRQYVDAYVGHSVQSKDMWIHGVCFAGLAVMSLLTYGNRTRPGWSRLWVWVCCIALGALLELLQEQIPGVGRNGNLRDVLDDILGTTLGIWLPLAFWPKTPVKGSRYEF